MTKRRDHEMTGRDFDRLSAAEKEAIYQECERIRPGDGKPLTEAQEARWRRAMRKAKSSRRSRPSKRVQISIEQALLKAADRFAAEHGMSRSQVIERGVRKLLAS
ncbi:MAG: ribbon-helix-helix protein, CopG family [Tepidisphaeraceae bacterium]